MKHNIPRGKHVCAKDCVCFNIPRIENKCPNYISDKINTPSLHGYYGYI